MRVRGSSLVAMLSTSVVALACAEDPATDDIGDASDTGDDATGEDEATDDGTGTGESESETDTDTGDPPPELPLCGTEPPPGATLAPELPSFGGAGTCPVLETGTTMNMMETSGGPREFMVVVPSDYREGEQLPVMVMYHWLGGDAIDFYERAEAQFAADYFRFIALIPEGREQATGVPWRWPFTVADEEVTMEQEYELFDDMLACVHEQFGVDKECISAMGVSAGAMWAALLGSRHGENMSSFISLSGGTGGDLVKPWVSTTNHMPALVLWGGRTDGCLGVNFEEISQEMEADLVADNHFIVECRHNCGHGTPPFEVDEPGAPLFSSMWQFFLDHPYWLEDGDSPYLLYPEMPTNWPDWCAVGAGNATMKVGECGPSEC